MSKNISQAMKTKETPSADQSRNRRLPPNRSRQPNMRCDDEWRIEFDKSGPPLRREGGKRRTTRPTKLTIKTGEQKKKRGGGRLVEEAFACCRSTETWDTIQAADLPLELVVVSQLLV